jgi:hypothetical protein
LSCSPPREMRPLTSTRQRSTPCAIWGRVCRLPPNWRASLTRWWASRVQRPPARLRRSLPTMPFSGLGAISATCLHPWTG